MGSSSPQVRAPSSARTSSLAVVYQYDRRSDPVRVWLVERTCSDDEQNTIILTYATTDGKRDFRKERALTSFGDVRDTRAAVDVDPGDLGAVDDSGTVEQYAAEAQRTEEQHDPDEVVCERIYPLAEDAKLGWS